MSVKSNRRQFLQLLGLGGAAMALPWLPSESPAFAQTSGAPKRVVFLTTQHGPDRAHWKMNPAGLPSGRDGATDITSLGRGDFSLVLEPLYDVRQHVNILDGLCMASSMLAAAESPIGNNHGISWASLLTNATGNYDDPFINDAGNIHPAPAAISIDQFIAEQTAPSGMIPSVVWGWGGRFGASDAFSSNSQGGWIPMTTNPDSAFNRIMGDIRPTMPTEPQPPTRAELLRASRSRVLSLAAGEFDRLAPRMSSADQETLRSHRDLMTRLGVQWNEGPGGNGGPPLSCQPGFNRTGDTTDDFIRLTTLALSCDVTRVVALNIGELPTTAFGAPAVDDVHNSYAHSETPEARLQMGNYYRKHAEQFASLVSQLANVQEGDGTLLDNTMVVWIPELATGGHEFGDTMTVVAGGGASGINLGQYTRFEQNRPRFDCGYGCGDTGIGPGHSHVFVNAMQHMGMSNTSFNRTEGPAQNGSMVDLTGPLAMLT